MSPTDADYQRLLRFRTAIRRFLVWSESEAGRVGLTPAQHQLLLCVRGHDDPRGPTIGDVADHLVLRHHSAVELVDRAEQANLVERERDEHDHRVVRLRLTPAGRRTLRRLSESHLAELERLAPVIRHLVEPPPS